jgi:hypothetical protein
VRNKPPISSSTNTNTNTNIDILSKENAVLLSWPAVPNTQSYQVSYKPITSTTTTTTTTTAATATASTTTTGTATTGTTTATGTATTATGTATTTAEEFNLIVSSGNNTRINNLSHGIQYEFSIAPFSSEKGLMDPVYSGEVSLEVRNTIY